MACISSRVDGHPSFLIAIFVASVGTEKSFYVGRVAMVRLYVQLHAALAIFRVD